MEAKRRKLAKPVIYDGLFEYFAFYRGSYGLLMKEAPMHPHPGYDYHLNERMMRFLLLSTRTLSLASPRSQNIVYVFEIYEEMIFEIQTKYNNERIIFSATKFAYIAVLQYLLQNGKLIEMEVINWSNGTYIEKQLIKSIYTAKYFNLKFMRSNTELFVYQRLLADLDMVIESSSYMVFDYSKSKTRNQRVYYEFDDYVNHVTYDKEGFAIGSSQKYLLPYLAVPCHQWRLYPPFSFNQLYEYTPLPPLPHLTFIEVDIHLLELTEEQINHVYGTIFKDLKRAAPKLGKLNFRQLGEVNVTLNTYMTELDKRINRLAAFIILCDEYKAPVKSLKTRVTFLLSQEDLMAMDFSEVLKDKYGKSIEFLGNRYIITVNEFKVEIIESSLSFR